MSIITSFIDFILNLDKKLGLWIIAFGPVVYFILFFIIMAETGLVVAPFLPGDSLLFAAGTFAAVGSLNVIVLFVSLSIAAILGDTINYWVGKKIGPKVFKYKDSKIFKREYLDKTHKFYEKYGSKTIVLARFVPIVRTFAPFIAGIGKMSYLKFLTYNVVGGILWVGLFVFGGYFVGNIPWVNSHFTWVILIIIIVSFMPMLIDLWKYYRNKNQTKNKPL